uniref:Calponin-homology (CH) domain-containing protein n=1 Tax=Timema genevievae TaxID=629358 RepID=A0A7R9K7A0_TIMGE|nr:unnamed protein product [Timema genevievae]
MHWEMVTVEEHYESVEEAWKVDDGKQEDKLIVEGVTEEHFDEGATTGVGVRSSIAKHGKRKTYDTCTIPYVYDTLPVCEDLNACVREFDYVSTSPGNWVPVRLSVWRNTGDALVIQRTVFQSYEQKLVRMEVEDLFTDLADGRKLLKLLEIISGEKLGKPNNGKMRVHRVENVNKSLAFLHTKSNGKVHKRRNETWSRCTVKLEETQDQLHGCTTIDILRDVNLITRPSPMSLSDFVK